METIKTIGTALLTIFGAATVIYYVPYLIRRGWGDAENKTKKVCDICFRDIKNWNEAVEKEINLSEIEGNKCPYRNSDCPIDYPKKKKTNPS